MAQIDPQLLAQALQGMNRGGPPPGPQGAPPQFSQMPSPIGAGGPPAQFQRGPADPNSPLGYAQQLPNPQFHPQGQMPGGPTGGPPPQMQAPPPGMGMGQAPPQMAPGPPGMPQGMPGPQGGPGAQGGAPPWLSLLQAHPEVLQQLQASMGGQGAR